MHNKRITIDCIHSVTAVSHFFVNESFYFQSFTIYCPFVYFFRFALRFVNFPFIHHRKKHRPWPPYFKKILISFLETLLGMLCLHFFFIINSITLYIRKYLKRKRLVKYILSHALHVNKFCWNVDGICKKIPEDGRIQQNKING